MFGANYRSSDEINDVTWMTRAQAHLEFCIWPRRCHSSGRWIWLQRAMHTTCMWTGPGDTLLEHRWYHPQEATIMMLKGSQHGTV